MRKFIFKFLRYSGLPFLIRFFIQRKKVTIVLFHNPKVAAADMAFKYLKSKYNIIDLNDYVIALKSQDFSSIPSCPMIITFDDGHINNHELLPLVKKYNVPITIFLCASIINTNRHFWFKTKLEGVLGSDLKSLSNTERLALLNKHDFDQNREYDNAQALNEFQIKEMAPFVNMQSHTLFHPILPKCKTNEARIEICHSKKVLEKNYNLNINTISYPNGDYSMRDIKLSKDAGYDCGITVDFGFNDVNTDIFRLKRISVNDTCDLNELIVKSSGLWGFFKTFNGRKQTYGFHSRTE
jgi:peptidoglycan/xylan/chitin deacetylase (PgdA/CDA1 family)